MSKKIVFNEENVKQLKHLFVIPDIIVILEDDNTLNPDLIEEFEEKKYPLSSEIEIHKIGEESGFIRDLSTKKAYILRAEEGVINVFSAAYRKKSFLTTITKEEKAWLSRITEKAKRIKITPLELERQKIEAVKERRELLAKNLKKGLMDMVKMDVAQELQEYVREYKELTGKDLVLQGLGEYPLRNLSQKKALGLDVPAPIKVEPTKEEKG